MSTFANEKSSCFVCGAESNYKELVSTNTFGSPDLDLRPPEMERSTMMTWVHQCPECGYASESVSDQTSVTKEWLQSPEYKTCGGINFKSDLARRFYQSYLIKLKDGQRVDAFSALIRAAWSSDDSCDVENAVCCRKLALQYIDDMVHAEPDNKDTYFVMKADLMRRAGLFKEVREEYKSIRFGEELLNKIIAFQLEKADAQDDKCYMVSDAVSK